MVESKTELTIIMPCLNEADGLRHCIEQAHNALQAHAIDGEVIVADNGSTDGSIAIAEELGARVINVPEKGYGNALMGGIKAARGRYCLMADADGSYDFTAAPRFLSALKEGAQLVMGNRFQGEIKPGAMPLLHRYLGNPVLSGIGRLFFHCPCRDFHCGIRAFERNIILNLDLRTSGMEFASEMVVKAVMNGLTITEIPVTLSADLRTGPTHLRTWRDGWRHLRFLLLFSPRWLFLYPGILFAVLGVISAAILYAGPVNVGGLTFGINTFVYACLAVLIGLQSVILSLFARTFAVTEGLLPRTRAFDQLGRLFSLEKGVLLGLALVFAGLGGSLFAVWQWQGQDLEAERLKEMLRLVVLSGSTISAGVQVVLSSFFVSVLRLGRRKRGSA